VRAIDLCTPFLPLQVHGIFDADHDGTVSATDLIAIAKGPAAS